MKDYASMSDSQINEMVHGIIKPESNLAWCFDYCNNPADAWPIITEYRISIIDLNDKEWGCRVESAHGGMRAINENALRCAMIVFLMMKEGE